MQTHPQSDRLNQNLSANFKVREFVCPCDREDCRKEGIQEDLVFHLQLAHDLLPKRSVIVVNSGYRCEEYNKSPKVNGSKTSSHLKGLAADLRCTSSAYRFSLLKALLQVGFKRVGIGEDFIHVDLDGTKDQKVSWLY